jgi:hypothetical protein
MVLDKGEKKIYRGKTYIAADIGWEISNDEKTKIIKKLVSSGGYCPDDGTKLVAVGLGLPPKAHLYCKKCNRVFNAKADFKKGD